MKLRDKIIRFFYGRNGNDALNQVLFWTYVILLVLNLFLRNLLVWMVELILVILYLFRAFSRNLYRRQNENRKFLKIKNQFTGFLHLQKNKFRDRKTHVYRKCPHCHVNLRLPKKKGKHSVKCPHCAQSFPVQI